MTKNNGFADRRRWYRFRVNDIARVDFTKPRVSNSIKPSVAKSALIIDISSGGLSFIYEDSQMRPSNFDKISVIVDANKIAAEDLPYQVISDYRIFPHHNATFARRCGIRFGELTSTQKFQLNSFIRNHTMYLQAVERGTGVAPGTSDGSLYSDPERKKIIERREHPLQT